MPREIWKHSIDFVAKTKERQGERVLKPINIAKRPEKLKNRIALSEQVRKTSWKLDAVSYNFEIQNTTPAARNFLKKYPQFFAMDSMDAIELALEKGLTQKELMIILGGRYQYLAKFPEARQEKILKVVQELKDDQMLDFVDIERLENFIGTSVFESDVRARKNEKASVAEVVAETPALRRVVQNAVAELGTSEHSGANKYFRDQGMRNSARGTPWCAAFINWVLRKSGLRGTGSNVAKSFIGLSGMGHAGIKVSNSRMVNGNWGNKVAYSSVPRFIRGYAIPTERGLIMKRWNFPVSQIPNGAIIVIDRNTRTRRGRRAT